MIAALGMVILYYASLAGAVRICPPRRPRDQFLVVIASLLGLSVPVAAFWLSRFR